VDGLSKADPATTAIAAVASSSTVPQVQLKQKKHTNKKRTLLSLNITQLQTPEQHFLNWRNFAKKPILKIRE
jgi:hypothetical protein